MAKLGRVKRGVASEPFRRLIEKRQLLAVPHDGFWRGMDTTKDRLELDSLWSRGNAPWQVWARPGG